MTLRPNRNLGLRHLLETDRMRLPDDPVEALEQLLREMRWLVQMIKGGRRSQMTLAPSHHSHSTAHFQRMAVEENAIQQFRVAIQKPDYTHPKSLSRTANCIASRATASVGDDAGWYVFTSMAFPAGAFGDWRSGLSEIWRADIGRKLSPRKKLRTGRGWRPCGASAKPRRLKRKAEAREKADSIWQAAEIASEYHPYLVNKGIKTYGLRVHDGALVIPMRDEAALHGLQFIEADGEKRFLTR